MGLIPAHFLAISPIPFLCKHHLATLLSLFPKVATPLMISPISDAVVRASIARHAAKDTRG